MPPRQGRDAWSQRKREALDTADIIFLDPDNGLGNQTPKHATLSEIERLRRKERAIVFITFPGRSMSHDTLARCLHLQLREDAGAQRVITLVTNVSVPRAPGSLYYVQRQRWLTVVDPDDELIARARAFKSLRLFRVSVRAFMIEGSN